VSYLQARGDVVARMSVTPMTLNDVARILAVPSYPLPRARREPQQPLARSDASACRANAAQVAEVAEDVSGHHHVKPAGIRPGGIPTRSARSSLL